MEQTSYKHKIDFLISGVTSLNEPSQTLVKYKRKRQILCNECNKKRLPLEESHQICHVCYKIKTVYKPKLSGNEVVDKFIRHTQINYAKNDGKMEFVPYDQFKDLEFIAKGGFSEVYKAIWIDGPIGSWSCKNIKNSRKKPNYTVVLKKLNYSKNITSKELNEVHMPLYTSLKSKLK